MQNWARFLRSKKRAQLHSFSWGIVGAFFGPKKHINEISMHPKVKAEGDEQAAKQNLDNQPKMLSHVVNSPKSVTVTVSVPTTGAPVILKTSFPLVKLPPSSPVLSKVQAYLWLG